jgi:hypothetical protein
MLSQNCSSSVKKPKNFRQIPFLSAKSSDSLLPVKKIGLYREKNISCLGYFWVKFYTNICTLYFNISAFSVHYQTQYLAKNSRFLGRKNSCRLRFGPSTAYICPSIVYNYTIWSHTGTVYYTLQASIRCILYTVCTMQWRNNGFYLAT